MISRQHGRCPGSWRARGFVAILACLALAAGCARKDEEPAGSPAATDIQPRTPGPRPAATEPASVPAPGPGRIEGVARYSGTSPLRVKVLTNDIDVAACGDRIHLQTVVLGAKGSLGNVFVELRREDGALVVPASLPAAGTVAIRKCALEPHVLVVAAGSRLEIRNGDGILHHLIGPALRNEPLEIRLPRYRKRLVLAEAALATPEKIAMSCAVHPWEVGWWIVTDNPLRALTGADGRFVLEGVPPGTWQLMAWHEDLPRVEQQVDVSADATVAIDLEFR